MTRASDFATEAVADFNHIVTAGELTKAATYKSLGAGAGTSVSVIFTRNVDDYTSQVEALGVLRTGEVRCLSTEVSSPAVKDTFTIDSDVWTVTGYRDPDLSGKLVCSVEMWEQVEIRQDNTRRVY